MNEYEKLRYAAGFPSPTNVFIPTASTNVSITANLVVNYSRSPSKFLLNQYIKLIPVKQRIGYYKRLSVGQQGRIQQPLMNEFLFNPGQDSPTGDWNKQGFANVKYATERYRFPTILDTLTMDQADYQIQAADVAMLAQQAMTGRTQLMLVKANTTGAWPATNTNNATSFAGGTWTSATGANPYIQKSIQQMAIQISLNTLSVVQISDMSVIVNPNLAASVSRSQEWRQFLANQVGASQFLQGTNPTGAMYNLWPHLYGVKLLIESTVVNNSQVIAGDQTANSAYIQPDANALMIGRPGDLPGSEAATDFATLGIFSYEEMTTETETDTWNRRIKMAVTEDFYVDIISPISGFLLTGCI